ncbi:MBL fold metallo-hydrolase [Nocardioides sp. NPDC087217]|uniref:MBL fold metallo-hydrolase n=1 Tax=Nocardioides sp. NPDC087217 TaxID=3364335 RepID=UPI003803320A
MAQPEEYAVESIAPHITRLPLPLPLEGLPLVNCYAITGSDGLTLVDPGWKSTQTEAALHDGLATLGADLADVRRILVTHSHWDHYTQALDLRDRIGAEVFLGRGEGHSIDALDLASGPYPRQVELLRRAGADGLADAVDNHPVEDHERAMPFTPPDQWLDDGDIVDCGGVPVVARSTPGHTRGHMVYELDGRPGARGWALTGDHVLPRITPSIAFEQAPEDDALASYVSSLQLLADVPDRQMLPAHGLATASVHDRVRELLDHHDERLKVVRDYVATGASTAYEVADQMRWTRRELRLSQLGTVHAMTAVLEVRSHLERLVRLDRLTVSGTAVEHYAA